MWVEDREAGWSVVLMGQVWSRFGLFRLCSVAGARAALAALAGYELAATEHACACRGEGRRRGFWLLGGRGPS